jgi:hypothetical protein
MTHYLRSEWINYVRQTVTEEQRAQMAQHLASGCGDCALDAVASTQITFALGHDYSTDESWTDQDAKEYWGAIAATIYDSFVDESARGMRGLGDSARYLLFQVGPLQIDVCLKLKDRSTAATLTGQIADSRSDQAHVPGTAVRVMNGSILLAETRTNQFGEFTVEYNAEKSPQICLCIGQKREVLIRV